MQLLPISLPLARTGATTRMGVGGHAGVRTAAPSFWDLRRSWERSGSNRRG